MKVSTEEKAENKQVFNWYKIQNLQGGKVSPAHHNDLCLPQICKEK